jgi:hypothetical protein
MGPTEQPGAGPRISDSKARAAEMDEELALRACRRRFLRAAGAVGLAALLSACGQTTDPVPPSATATATPTATATLQGQRIGGIPTLTPSATSTPGGFESSPLRPSATQTMPSATATEAEPTATRPPTATPTPPPTPFPPGPPTKLGLVVAWVHSQVMDLVGTGNVSVVKTLEFDPVFLADIKAQSPQTVVVGRVGLPELNLSRADPVTEARRAVDAVLPLAHDPRRAGLVDAWEGFNEPTPGDEDQMRRVADLEAERVRLLADNGLRAVVGNFGTGQPPLEWWPAFRPALEVAHSQDAFLGLHEYSAPTMWFQTTRTPLDFGADPADEGWLTLRYRKVYRGFLEPWGLRLPLLITECGVDGMVADRPGPAGRGWMDFRAYWAELGMGLDAPGNYIEQLAWYDRELRLDDYVVGAAVFAMTAFQQWASYELRGDAAAILQQYLSVHPVR